MSRVPGNPATGLRLNRRAALRLGAAAASAGLGAIPASSPAFGAGADPAGPHVSTAMETGPVRLTSTPLEPAAPSLNTVAIMVAGPADEATTRWAALLADPLARILRPGAALQISALGGRDGVTGANAFEALTNPDGSTALLVPGTAALAWLAGDPRVHFDAGRWIPALTSFGSAVLIGRTAPERNGASQRVAASTAYGPELAALLGLTLLGGAPSPVFGLSDPDDAFAAMRDGRVDAILLTGREVPRRAAAITGTQFRPILSFGADWSGAPRDPLLADVPTLPELYIRAYGTQPAGPLFAAWKAAAAASRLDAALVLQPLTPAALVAQWRQASGTVAAGSALTAAAMAAQLRLLPAPDCVAALDTIVADETTLLTLRRWLAGRTGWRPA